MGRNSLFPLYLSRFQQFYLKYRTIPVMQECAEILWLASKASVFAFYQQMIDEWYLSKKEWRYYPWVRLTTIPLFASVQAGNPTDASDEKIDDIDLDAYLIDDPRETIFVTVKGESMIEAGIHEWDVLVVDKQKKPREWDIVVAVVDGEFTVKYLRHDAMKKRVLDPANKNFSRIIPEHSLELCGVVTWSFRKY